MTHSKTTAKSPAGNAAVIALYCNGTDSDRDRVEADHPGLITAAIRDRAATARPLPERTWTNVGAEYTTPDRRPDVLRAIASLQWQEPDGDELLELPAMPGFAIQACIRELRIPRISQIAWRGDCNAVDWRDEDGEGEHCAIYGIHANYSNGHARLYVLDTGTAQIPLVSDFWATPVLAA